MPLDRSNLAPALLIIACALLAYANSLPGSFQYDDFNVIVDEPAVHSWSAWWASMPGIRPLLKASYTLNWTLANRTLSFHLFNLLLHTLNGVMLYWLARHFFTNHGKLPEKAAGHAALLAALLFTLHPANTEAVTYISGRSISLTASFYLAAILCHLHSGRQPMLRWLGVACFALALSVKEVGVTLPFALWLWSRGTSDRPAAHLWPYFTLLAAGLLLILLTPIYDRLVFYSLEHRSLSGNVPAAMAGVLYLAGKLFWPVGLSIDPDIVQLPADSILLRGEWLVLGLLIALALWHIRRPQGRWHTPAFALLWFVLHLLPTHSLIPRLDPANDRQLYLAAIGPFFAIAYYLNRLWQAPAMPLRALPVLLLGLLAGATVARNHDYRSETQLWRSAAAIAPNKPRVLNNLGYALAQEGQYCAAERAYLTALHNDPQFSIAAANLRNLRALPAAQRSC